MTLILLCTVVWDVSQVGGAAMLRPYVLAAGRLESTADLGDGQERDPSRR